MAKLSAARSKIRNLAVLWLVAVLFLSACSMVSTQATAPEIPGLAQTLAAQTLTAQQGMYSPFLATPTPPVAAQPASMVQAPADTAPIQAPAPTQTPLRKNIKAGEAIETCTNAAEFVKDITIPDGTNLKPNQRFTKTWRFKNAGTCTWKPEYAVVFVWGDRMDGADPVLLGRTVAPGETIDVSVALMAPKQENYYQGNWMFQDTHGNTFGTGYRGRNFFWVAISIGGGGGGGGGRTAGLCGGGG